MGSRSSTDAVHGVAEIEAMTPQDFTREIPRKWNALEGVIDRITEQVGAEKLTPQEGYRLVSCAVAEVFDYQATHGSLLSINPLEAFAMVKNLYASFGGR